MQYLIVVKEVFQPFKHFEAHIRNFPAKIRRACCSLIKLDEYPTLWNGRMTNEILSRLVTDSNYLLQTNNDQKQ